MKRTIIIAVLAVGAILGVASSFCAHARTMVKCRDCKNADIGPWNPMERPTNCSSCGGRGFYFF